MTKDEALKLALEALEEAWYHVGTFQPTEKAIDLYDEARTAIKEALSEPEQYPQIAINPEIVGYVAPQRTWVGLTDEDIWEAYMESTVELDCSTDELYALSRTVEAKLKDKNTLLKNNRRK